MEAASGAVSVPAPRGREALLATLIGLLAAGISLLRIGVPAAWFDEIATLQAVRLSPEGLGRFLEHKDAVHGTYYAIMHGWTQLFGVSEVSIRSFSALCIGIAAAGLVVLCARFGDLRLGVIAGVIFAVLPRTTALGIEGRSYALAAAIAVIGFIVLVIAARRGSWWWWLLYAVLCIFGIYVFMYGVLILAAHLAYVLSVHRDRGTVVRWGISAVMTLIAVIPLVRAGYAQREQIAWLSGQPLVNAWTALVEPWFDGSWLLAIGVIVLLSVAGRRLGSIIAARGVGIVVIAAGWSFLPLILLLIANSLVGPLYTSRYMSFTVPGIALLLAVLMTAFSRRWVSVVLIAAIALASLPTFLAQREPFAKAGGSDFRQSAELIAEHAAPGDAFFLQNDGTSTLRPRLAFSGYPELFAGLSDIAFLRSDLEQGNFYDLTRTPAQLGDQLEGVSTLWVARSVSGSREFTKLQKVLEKAGFAVIEEYPVNRTVIMRYGR